MEETLRLKNNLHSLRKFTIRFGVWNTETLVLSLIKIYVNIYPNKSIDTHFKLYTHPLKPFHLTYIWTKLAPELLILALFLVLLSHEILVLVNFFRTTRVLDKKKGLIRKKSFRFTWKFLFFIFCIIYSILKFIVVKVFVTLMTYVKLRPLQSIKILLTTLFLVKIAQLYADWVRLYWKDFHSFDVYDPNSIGLPYEQILDMMELLSLHFEEFRKYSCYLLFLNVGLTRSSSFGKSWPGSGPRSTASSRSPSRRSSSTSSTCSRCSPSSTASATPSTTSSAPRCTCSSPTRRA